MTFVGDPLSANPFAIAQPGDAAATLPARRNNRRQEMLEALGRADGAQADVESLLPDAAALVAESLAADYYGAVQLNPQRNAFLLRLIRAEQDNGAAEIIGEQRGRYDDAGLLVARALASGEVIATSDFADDARFDDAELQSYAVRGALVAPLRLDDQSIGAIGVFFATPRTFTADELLFAEAIAQLVAVAVGRQQAVQALEDERQFSRTLVQTIDAFVLTLDTAGRIVRCNPAFEKMTGFTMNELRDRPIWNTLLVSDEVPAVRETLEKALKSKQPIEHECLILTKDGERRRVRWSHAANSGAGGKRSTLVSTGIDMTRQRAVEEKLARLEAANSNAKNLLGALPAAGSDGNPSAPSATAINPAAQFQRLPEGSDGDRRKRPRRAFNFRQRIAAVTGGRLPDPRTFSEVVCNDISSGGFSFVTPTPPGHSTYVVALGVPPSVMYVLAKVIHTRAVTAGGQTNYVVGCQYTGRAEYEK
jgi:PAS domain S-box-containing protein